MKGDVQRLNVKVVKKTQSDCTKFLLQSGPAWNVISLCKSAHEKIKITRTHRILPYGTLLEFNIERNATINEHNPAIKATVIELDTHFLDITLSDVEVEEEEPSCKRKREDEAEDDENESFELVYETPMAKIGYKNNKRMHLEVVCI